MANLESSSLVKKDNAACAHEAATLGPIEEAKNATYNTYKALDCIHAYIKEEQKPDFSLLCHEAVKHIAHSPTSILPLSALALRW
jgi:hypothetical protein